jgi:hypothetical protein
MCKYIFDYICLYICEDCEDDLSHYLRCGVFFVVLSTLMAFGLLCDEA